MIPSFQITEMMLSSIFQRTFEKSDMQDRNFVALEQNTELTFSFVWLPIFKTIFSREDAHWMLVDWRSPLEVGRKAERNWIFGSLKNYFPVYVKKLSSTKGWFQTVTQVYHCKVSYYGACIYSISLMDKTGNRNSLRILRAPGCTVVTIPCTWDRAWYEWSEQQKHVCENALRFMVLFIGLCLPQHNCCKMRLIASRPFFFSGLRNNKKSLSKNMWWEIVTVTVCSTIHLFSEKIGLEKSSWKNLSFFPFPVLDAFEHNFPKHV